MNQGWNIFRKDFRHHWREIAAYLAILVAFTWFEVRDWTQPASAVAFGAAASIFFASQFLSSLVVALVPISWIFLIVRVVQGESLVGDRQFWVTRPYDWRKLLAAKALFVLAFINLPLFVVDVLLLARAGFHPTSYLSGLLGMQVMLIFVVFLATAALATVTATIPQLLLAALLAGLFAICLSALASIIPNASFSSRGDSFSAVLFIVTSMAVILLQYSRRRTAISRWLIVGLGALITLIMIATPYRWLIARDYPLSKGELPIHLTLLPAKTTESSSVVPNERSVPIHLPLSLSGLPNDSFLQLDGIVVTLTNAAGFRWDSGWLPQGPMLFPDQKTVDINFALKPSIFDQMKSGSISAHLMLAFTLYSDKDQRQFVVPSGRFTLPELGWCSSETQYWRGRELRCLVPPGKPTFLLITSEMAASTCPLRKEEPPVPPGKVARRSIGGGGFAPGISPIHVVDIYLMNWDSALNRDTSPGICPGTPLTLSRPEAASRQRLELQFDNLSLDAYRAGPPVTVK